MEGISIPRGLENCHLIPLLKFGKDPFVLNSYGPIPLTSWLSKTYERLTNKRPVFILESNNVLGVNECCFRFEPSTLDHLFRLKTVVREAFFRHKHCVRFQSI